MNRGSVYNSLMVVNVYGGDVGRDTDVTLLCSLIHLVGMPYGLGRGVSYDRRTDLVHVSDNMSGQRYVNEILRPVVVRMAHRIGLNFMVLID